MGKEPVTGALRQFCSLTSMQELYKTYVNKQQENANS